MPVPSAAIRSQSLQRSARRDAGPTIGGIVRALKASLFVLFAGTMAAVSLIAAQSKVEAMPPRDGQHDFDFAFGGWKTHISRLLHPLTDSNTWVEYDGTHVIRKIWNGKANLGELEADGPAGHIEAMSPRLYDPGTRQWSIWYGNPHDGGLSKPVIGKFMADGRGEFYGQETVNGREVLVREIYAAVNPNTRKLEIAYSADGGKTWETHWKMIDTKIANYPIHE
jgi:hypothetical protein